MPFLYLDTETYCETPINNGTHRYAETAEIVMWQWCVDDAPVQVSETLTAELEAMLYDEAYTIVCHNSGFDRTVLRHNGIDIPVERWHDTMVQAMAHSLPGGLGVLCQILGVPVDQAKDKAGKNLIKLFCQPRPANSKLRRATKETHPDKWAEFLDYGRLDVEAMREVHKRLPNWNYKGRELDLWRLDQKINDRGVCIDLDLAHAAIRAADREQARLSAQTVEMTDGEVAAATQRDKLLAHILQAYGVGLPDLKTSTLERRIEDPDLPPELKELLSVRVQSCKTSVSKYRRAINGTSSDGRLRGLLQFCGAARTGRWAGRMLQPQNFSRGTVPHDQIEPGIEAMKANVEDLL